MLKESPERFVPDLVGRIDAEDPGSLIVDLSTYQVFDTDSAVVTLMYTNIASNGLGIVVWNLEPGQENDFHRHPDTEHIHHQLLDFGLSQRQTCLVFYAATGITAGLGLMFYGHRKIIAVAVVLLVVVVSTLVGERLSEIENEAERKPGVLLES